jgi:hypothetical protein
MSDWLLSPAVMEASKLFRRLCQRSYGAHFTNRELIIHQVENLELPIEVNLNAVVWRHWYSSLNQMMSRLKPKEHKKITVTQLPGGVSIAGEWYWAVPAHSAAPEVGLDVIKLLTKHSAELERLELGVGLPTRQSFYDTLAKTQMPQVSIPPYFFMDSRILQKLVNTAFRRSTFGCYKEIFIAVAHHLQRIIEIADGPENQIEQEIQGHLNSLLSSTEFIRQDLKCGGCHKGSHKT